MAERESERVFFCEKWMEVWGRRRRVFIESVVYVYTGSIIFFIFLFLFLFLFYFFILGLNEKREREKEMICVES